MQNTASKVVYSFSRPLKSVNTEKNGPATNRDAKLFENFDSKFFIVGVSISCKGFHVFRGAD